MIVKPVVTASAMREFQERVLGTSSTSWIEKVGRSMATYLKDHQHPLQRVTLLCGYGHKGSEAYSVGCELLQLGVAVRAYSLGKERDFLCQRMRDKFAALGGQDEVFRGFLERSDILIDGLLDSEFLGKIEGELLNLILCAQDSKIPIYAIDLPSGLHGDTGCVSSMALKATTTLSLGALKLGLFTGGGFEYVGEIVEIPIEIDEADLRSLPRKAELLISATSLMPKIQRLRHKYQAGYVVGFGSSRAFRGAGLLASFAALKMGAGVARLFYPEGAEIATMAPLELICTPWNLSSLPEVHNELQRAQAAFIGPGMGRDLATQTQILSLFQEITIPCVIDADALYTLSLHPNTPLPQKSILTPHFQEMQRLGHIGHPLECLSYAERWGVTLVLKGAPTWIFQPGRVPCIVMEGDPGMATAGAGDVLTGMISGLLAQGLEPWDAACLGVFLHGSSGRRAAQELSSYCVVASDLIRYLPSVVLHLGRGIE